MKSILTSLLLLLSSIAGLSQTWSPLGMSNRYDHGAVWDPNTNTMIVVGGTNGNQTFNDVWAYSAVPTSNHGLKWTQVIQGSTSPGKPRLQRTPGDLPAANTMTAPPRMGVPAVYWAANKQIVFCGGDIYLKSANWPDRESKDGCPWRSARDWLYWFGRLLTVRTWRAWPAAVVNERSGACPTELSATRARGTAADSRAYGSRRLLLRVWFGHL